MRRFLLRKVLSFSRPTIRMEKKMSDSDLLNKDNALSILRYFTTHFAKEATLLEGESTVRAYLDPVTSAISLPSREEEVSDTLIPFKLKVQYTLQQGEFSYTLERWEGALARPHQQIVEEAIKAFRTLQAHSPSF